ncbi:MAG TPA: SHOCT domain-containing protein [Pirellulales bacterium]|jgi:hypothetical protein|nr:SHOCT domain-containing protein [Pirellulales bacterium]
MSLPDELERLAQLHDAGSLSDEEFSRAKGKILAPGGAWPMIAGVRRRSTRTVLGVPLWAIATGPDPARGERIGHARAIFAMGDMATGVFALGGIARGIVAVGGVAYGGFALGGAAIGLLIAIGGAALGSFALGGAAVGFIAIGGAAVGYYALGGAAMGKYVVGPMRQDPQAMQLLKDVGRWFGF